MIETLIYPIIFFFVYITSFMFHELMHIKSQGLTATGTIQVNTMGMTVGVDHMNNTSLFMYGGGIITSVIMFILVFITSGWWQWCYLTLGYIQLIYGLYEGYTNGDVTRFRYIIYVTIIVIMLLVWMVK